MSLLNIQEISLRFNNMEKPALTQINYQVNPGDFIILLGGNGSGKSSLLKLLHRDLQPNTGDIQLFNQPLSEHSPKYFRQSVSMLTQDCCDSLFTSLTVYENYLMAKSENQNKQMERDYLRAYLRDFNPNLAYKLHTQIDHLSGGEKQALALALCLLTPPSLLLLDEHTSALDPRTAQQIMQLTAKMLARHQITCILTTHDLDIALRYGNRILMLHEGRILKTFEPEQKNALSKETLLQSYY